MFGGLFKKSTRPDAPCVATLVLGLDAKDFTMFRGSLFVGALLGQHVSAQNMLRFGCSQLTIERADPLVSPGQNPAPHTHQIIGGNSFNLTVVRMNLMKGRR